MKKQALILGASLLLPAAFLSNAAAAPQTAGQVVIINTGDRLTPGYRVTVGPHGSLTGVIAAARQRTSIRRTDRMVSVNRQRFFADLAQAEPLSNLPTGSVAAPPASGSGRRGRGRRQVGTASPGLRAAGINPLPQVFVQYKGQQSSNLRAASSPSGQALYQDVKQILQVLRLPIPDVP